MEYDGLMRDLLRLTMVAGALGLSACSDDGPDLSVEEASRIWTTGHDQLHETHLATTLADTVLQQSYSYPCPDGGTIEMELTFRATEQIRANLENLIHVYVDCQRDGLTFNGEMNYLNVSICADNRPSFQVAGELSVSGAIVASRCAVEGDEVCGALSGSVCGIAVQ